MNWFGWWPWRRRFKLGIYGEPNAGKTTLANRLSEDFEGERVGSVSALPHETRSLQAQDVVLVNERGQRLVLSVLDTPGLAGSVRPEEFVRVHGLSGAEARARAREVTQGILDAIAALKSLGGLVIVVDSTVDPYTHVHEVLLANARARGIRVIVAANKVDDARANVQLVREAFGGNVVVPVSALSGLNMDEFYGKLVEVFE